MQQEDIKFENKSEIVKQVNFIFQKHLEELDAIDRKGAILKQRIEQAGEQSHLASIYNKILNIE